MLTCSMSMVTTLSFSPFSHFHPFSSLHRNSFIEQVAKSFCFSVRNTRECRKGCHQLTFIDSPWNLSLTYLLGFLCLGFSHWFMGCGCRLEKPQSQVSNAVPINKKREGWLNIQVRQIMSPTVGDLGLEINPIGTLNLTRTVTFSLHLLRDRVSAGRDYASLGWGFFNQDFAVHELKSDDSCRVSYLQQSDEICSF